MVDIADAARSGRLGNVTIRTRKGGNKKETVEKIRVSKSGRVSSRKSSNKLDFVVGSSADKAAQKRKQDALAKAEQLEAQQDISRKLKKQEQVTVGDIFKASGGREFNLSNPQVREALTQNVKSIQTAQNRVTSQKEAAKEIQQKVAEQEKVTVGDIFKASGGSEFNLSNPQVRESLTQNVESIQTAQNRVTAQQEQFGPRLSKLQDTQPQPVTDSFGDKVVFGAQQTEIERQDEL